MITFLKIINFLGKHIHEEFTMHELSNLLDIPYASFYRYVKHLNEQKVLDVRKIGKAKVVGLNLKYPIIKANLTAASFEETQEFVISQPIVKKIWSELKTKDIVLLFGSYAKRAQSRKSDINIMVINEKGDKSISFSKYEVLFRVKINPIFVKRTEFVTMLEAYDENVGKQVLKNHIILTNFDGFWECVLDAL